MQSSVLRALQCTLTPPHACPLQVIHLEEIARHRGSALGTQCSVSVSVCVFGCAHVACLCIKIGARSRCSTSAREALASALADEMPRRHLRTAGAGLLSACCLSFVCCTRCCTPMPSLAPVCIARGVAGRCSLLCSDIAAALLDAGRGPPTLIPGATGGEPPTSTVALVADATGSAALQPSQKLFEGHLASACQRFDLTKPVFIEAESQKVRGVCMRLLLGQGASKSCLRWCRRWGSAKFPRLFGCR